MARRRADAPKDGGRDVLARAVAAHRAGHLDEAWALYDRVLAANPAEADALHLSGLIRHARGDREQALARIAAAITLKPATAAFHNSIGVVRLEGGDIAGAEEAFRTALALDPALAEAANNLGNALQATDRIADAIAAYDCALSLRPTYAEAHVGRGRALQRLNRTADAIAALKSAIAARPTYARAHRYLADALAQAGERKAAEQHYRTALALHPGDGEALAGLAALRERAGRLEEALSLAEEALAAQPGALRARLIAARCERRLGRLDAALARLAGADTAAAADDLRAMAAFEYAMLQDQRGDVDAAFAAFTEANERLAATPAGRSADAEHFPALIRRIKDTFSREWLASWAGAPAAPGAEPAAPAAEPAAPAAEPAAPAAEPAAPAAEPAVDPADPIFLIGFPRSGTTLLEQILDAHSGLAALEEKPVLDAVCKEVDGRPAGYPAALADLAPADIAQLRQRYWREVARYLVLPVNTRLVDKMPLNIIDVGLIARLFPRATLLLALRHPCDVVLSNFMQAFQPNAAMTHFTTLAGAARFYADVMDLWLHLRALLPLTVVTVRYEDLTRDVEGEARRLFAALRLPWEPQVLAFAEHARARAIATPSYHQVTQPIYRGAVGRWQRYAAHLAPLLPILAPFIRAFGYDDAPA